MTVRRTVVRLTLEPEVKGSTPGTVKIDTVSSAACHRFEHFSKGVVFPGLKDAEIGPDNLSLALARFSECCKEDLM